MSEVIIDVREKDEFEAEHIENSIHVPLSKFSLLAPGILNQLKTQNVLIMCRSGKRAKLAETQISQLGYSDKISAAIFEGGILRWKELGRPTLIRKKGHLPIMRQVQLTAGSLILISSALAALLSPKFLYATAFIGMGLTIAGATGFCGMANLLALMPWNKTSQTTHEELCQVSPGNSDCSK